MDNTIIIALIGYGGSALIAVTALLLNYRGFASIDGRIASLEGRMLSFETKMLSFENRVDSRLNMMQSDMKDLNKTMIALELDVAKLKDKAEL